GPLGNWSCTPTTPLPAGQHTFTAKAADEAGNVSAADTVTFTVTQAPDTTPPAAPVIVLPLEGSSTADTTPTVTGTAEPGSTVTVTEGGTTICTAQTGPLGNWSCTPTTPLPAGQHTFTAKAADEAGNVSAADTVTFTVITVPPGDTTPPDAPVITTPANGSTTTNTTPVISGTAEPGSTVTVTEGGTTICTAQTGPLGNWSCTPTTPLPAGQHTVSATATDAAGNTSPAATTAFTVAVVTPTDPAPLNDPDTDGDGLTDSTEVNTTKTDPTKADTDGDGLSDGKEVNSTKTDPTNPDTDGDRLTDGQEVNGMVIKERFEVCGRKAKKKITVRTNPLVKDTDKDGLTDGVEVKGFTIKQRVFITRSGKSIVIGKTRTNPTKADTDKDGLKDKVEKTGKANKKFGKHKTDPSKCDTDRGGVSDGKEVKAGSDPSQIKSGPNDLESRMAARREGRSYTIG
ncbi:Ig-like domain-containing protein, partial [Nocardioides currus]